MISTQILFILIIIVLGVTGVIVYFLSSQIKNLRSELQNDNDQVLMEWLKEMKGSVEKNSEVLERQLTDQRSTLHEQLKSQREAMNQQTKLIWERLDKASEVIQGVQQHLGGIQEFGKDMKDLSNVLKSPKLRGGLGEQLLYEILANALPANLYKTQFRFRDGSICDAVIFTDRGSIPIDSKFPMENFKLMVTHENPEERERTKRIFIRDVKKRIDEISKYILPEEGTADFAVMYIPSENVYYELLVNTSEIEEYARQKCIFLTSPNTFSYQVRSILVAYQQQELQKHAGEILKALSGIKVEAEKFEEELTVLDGHIDRTAKSISNVRNKYSRLFSKIDAVERLGDGEVAQGPLLEE